MNSTMKGERVGVSIIIPCHNQARWLGEAIASAQVQGSDCEIIVVNDGSTDETAAIAASFDGIKLIQQRNRGLSAARNAGLSVSSGDLVVFLDADDRLLTGGIEAGRRALANEPAAAFAAGGFHRIDEAGHVLAMEPAAPVEHPAYAALLRQSPFPMHAALLFRRSAVAGAGGYDETLDSCEDFDLYCRLLRHGHWVRHDYWVAAYRRHDANMSGNHERMVASALTVMGRQWPHARDDASLRAAFDAGVQFWVTAYGNSSVWPAAAGKFMQGGRAALAGTFVLWQHVPRWMFTRSLAHLRMRFEWIRARLGVLFGSEATTRSAILQRAARVPRGFPVPIGHVDFGDFDRVEPIDRHFGFWRGWPIDRYYIDRFLLSHAGDVRGRVMEVKDPTYIWWMGGSQVESAEVVDIDAGNPMATTIADLTDAAAIPSDSFDCIILTQTLHVIYDVQAALFNVYRILKPGGVVLATVPGITKVDRTSPWFWSFTADAARRRFEEVFPADHVHVEAHGNLLTATAFLQGLAIVELPDDVFAVDDEEYPVSVCIRAVKPGEPV